MEGAEEARFKNDPAAQQQAVMKLYKDEKINPLLGCLPTLHHRCRCSMGSDKGAVRHHRDAAVRSTYGWIC